MTLTRITAATAAGSSAANEDHLLASGSWALVLDGVTRYPDDGCVHDVPWYVANLGAALAAELATDNDIREVLRAGIAAVTDRHRRTCDVGNPVTPAATAAIARFGGDRFEWLVLGDSAVVLHRRGREPRAESDDRLARLTDPPPVEPVGGLRRYPVDYLARVRNRPGGFWVAAADPDAADAARFGSEPIAGLESAALVTDGITRLVERYGRTWTELLDLAASGGAERLIAEVRAAERADRRFGPGSKRHDDATAVLLGLG